MTRGAGQRVRHLAVLGNMAGGALGRSRERSAGTRQDLSRPARADGRRNSPLTWPMRRRL